MNTPTRMSRSYMDSLLAFWPGLQVLWGDVDAATHTHDMDPYYLDMGKTIVDNLNRFAAIKDLRNNEHEDRYGGGGGGGEGGGMHGCH